jgi:hypothetical protein
MSQGGGPLCRSSWSPSPDGAEPVRNHQFDGRLASPTPTPTQSQPQPRVEGFRQASHRETFIGETQDDLAVASTAAMEVRCWIWRSFLVGLDAGEDRDQSL